MKNNGLGRGRRCHRKNRRDAYVENGDNYHIVGYCCEDCDLRKKLMNYGLFRGEEFKVIGKAPMGDPIEIKINGYRLFIRNNELKKLILKKI